MFNTNATPDSGPGKLPCLVMGRLYVFHGLMCMEHSFGLDGPDWNNNKLRTGPDWNNNKVRNCYMGPICIYVYIYIYI